MGSGVSREHSNVPHHPDGRCETCKVENSHQTNVNRVINVNPAPVKRFFYYPKQANETVYVHTSEFPYSKPKVVTVRRRQAEDHESRLETDSTACPGTPRNITDQSGLVADTTGYFLINSMQMPPERLVNERRWSAANVMPTDNKREKLVLPNRACFDRRRPNHQVQPYGRHYSFTCDMPLPVIPISVDSGKRPPTPVPVNWFPAQRTSDYLVASSLLAVEHERDRIKNTTTDIHDF
ncbi:hypothetical protein DPMN_089039 [Dreissena polymorpha]|uniref:Uncharacterized protein n=1 Tax=Dreissena polymorpha TaxID=45954 RepID=A0A9D4QWZ0_DREPO|nr:hypothetical protein DPMN_089039 [Dreissena polymorpha]